MKQVLARFVTFLLIAALTVAIMPSASAEEIPLETASEGFLGLAVCHDGGSWQQNDLHGYSGSTQTVAKEGCSGTTVYTPIPSKLTLKNDTSQPASLSFDYAVMLNSGTILIDGVNILSDGNFSISLRPMESIEINLLPCDYAEYRTCIVISNIHFTLEGNIQVTFAAPVNGTYSVEGLVVTEQFTVGKRYDSPFHLAATPAPGYTFLGWFNDLDHTCLSENATDTVLIPCDSVIYPYFYREGTLQLQVGEETFNDLNAADYYASAHNHEPIILLSDGELSAGTYAISKGNTLLIPCDGDFSLYTTDPDAIEQKPDFNNTQAYCTLTLGAGATLNVNGSLSVAGKQNMQQPCLGATTGDYGYIQLSEGSNITVNNGGKLYCWGYITGAGTVTAKKGATVYEPFQIMDFRGGTATMQMMSQGVYPISQYYVQNIESRLTLEYGAREYVRTVTNAGKAQGMPMTPATVPFIDRAGANSLFQMENGCTFTKYYDAAEDRLCFEINGNCSINSISLTIVGGEDGLTINSGDYVLQLPSSYTIHVQTGTTAINRDLLLQPGSILTVAEGAQLTVASIEDTEAPASSHPVQLIACDSEDWGNYCGPKNQPFCPIRYTPSGPDHIRNVETYELSDATVDVNGTLALDGCLYTTEHGANITSFEGTGVILFHADAPEEGVVCQVIQSGVTLTSEAQAILPALLHNRMPNATGSEYTGTAGAKADTLFHIVENAHWEECVHTWILDRTVAPTCVEDGFTQYCCPNCGSVKQENILPAAGHQYENGICTVCGAMDAALMGVKIDSVSLTLYQDIAVVYTATVPEGLTDPYMVIEVGGQSHTLQPGYVDTQGRLVFRFMHLTPDKMGDNIKATLYAACNGTPVEYCKPEYSVKQYCTNVMAAYPDDQNLQTLLADMLIYGAAAQRFTGHNTTNLVTKGFDLSAASTFEDLTNTDFSRTGTPSAELQWTGAGLECGSQMSMYFTLNTTIGDATSVEITVNGRTTVYSYADMTVVDESDFGETCRVVFRGLSASEYGDVVTAVLKNNGEQVGQTLTYSVNSYVYSKQHDTSVVNLAQLVQAIYNYGVSASRYLK